MKTTKQKNLVMIMIAAVILVAVNIGIWMAASKGAISPVDNMMLWGGFVVLNVASILWAISLLGLQPFVVSLSYVAGGALAYMGVRGMSDISVAEVTTAGATYGAFGALAIGNMTAKVRLAFFNKGQVPFIFIIVGLLVIDAVLNSGVAGANGSVILNAVVLPFMIAGVVVGLIWSVLNRYGIGRKPQELLAEIAAEERGETVADTQAESSQKLVIKMPDHAVAEEEPAVEEVIATPEPVVVPEPMAPAAETAEPAPVLAEAAPVVEEKQEEEFYPLEIDKDDNFVAPVADHSLEEAVAAMETPVEEESFDMPEFNNDLYASGSMEEEEATVLVQEPEVAVTNTVEVQQNERVEEVQTPVAEVQPEEPAKVEEQKEGGSDWLGGHLDLLNKLK